MHLLCNFCPDPVQVKLMLPHLKTKLEKGQWCAAQSQLVSVDTPLQSLLSACLSEF